jgi:hypothetical protein
MLIWVKGTQCVTLYGSQKIRRLIHACAGCADCHDARALVVIVVIQKPVSARGEQALG